jgi:DNA (cytosine-5)-methyltransferase 1
MNRLANSNGRWEDHAMLCQPFVIGQQSGAVARSIEEPMPTVSTAGAIRLVEPFIAAYHNGDGSERRTHSLDEPLPTQDTSNRFALVEPFAMHITHRGNDAARCHSLDKPLPTITTAKRGEISLVEPVIVKYYGNGDNCRSLNEPLPTVTTRDRFMLVQFSDGTKLGLDILTRMLQPTELAACHSFPKSYRFTGNKEDQTTQIGNSVPVELAAAHAEAALI